MKARNTSERILEAKMFSTDRSQICILKMGNRSSKSQQNKKKSDKKADVVSVVVSNTPVAVIEKVQSTARSRNDIFTMKNNGTNQTISYIIDSQCQENINLKRYNIFQSDDIIEIKNTLTNDCQFVESIANIIIKFMIPTYKSFCNVSLTFEHNSDNVISAVKPFRYIDELKRRSIRYNICCLAMGSTVNNIPRLNCFRHGSGYGSIWGSNREVHADFELHSYSNINIKYVENVADKINMKFNLYYFDFNSDDFIFECESDNVGYRESNHPFTNTHYANCKILCVDYTHSKSLQFAEKYAERFSKDTMYIVFVITQSISNKEDNKFNNKYYFTFQDVVQLALKYNASVFEMSTEVDDNCLFVYTQILLEYHEKVNKKM
eukprot:545467_1